MTFEEFKATNPALLDPWDWPVFELGWRAARGEDHPEKEEVKVLFEFPLDKGEKGVVYYYA